MPRDEVVVDYIKRFSKSRRRAKDIALLIDGIGAPMYLGSGMSYARVLALLEEFLPRKRNETPEADKSR